VVGVVFVAAANLILPQLTNASSINLTAGNLSYFGFIAFIASTAYAVIYHRLFDLRLFVVRAAAYAFTVSLVTIFYLAPAIWVISRVVKVHLTGYELLGLIAISLVLTIVYRYLRRLFDQITNRVFFRNFYDTQDVLDKLSELLVRTIDVTQIEEGSKKILLGALHATSLGYWLNEGADKTVTETLQALFKRGDNLVVLDEHEGVANKLAELLKEDVALVVRLRTTHGELGYMTIGFKASGQMYSTQDKRLLSTAADEIAISMQNALHFAEIQNFNLTLQERVQKATLELRKTNEKLKALDETKDEFITMASHQLRTPLTSVKGYLSMVLEGDAGKLNAQQEQLLRQSYASSQRMVFLISDLLNLSRLNTGKFVFEPMPVDLPGVVKSEVEQLAETAKSREVQLVYDGPSVLPKLLLDETKIHQVVMNFIDNAIYYTPAGGTITVSLAETPTAVEFRVKDTGIGVPRAVQHKLFTKFYRAANAQRARPDGTGLGLFMAKKVIVGQGGSVIFDSEEGKGSTFGFRFSKAKHAVEKKEEG